MSPPGGHIVVVRREVIVLVVDVMMNFVVEAPMLVNVIGQTVVVIEVLCR